MPDHLPHKPFPDSLSLTFLATSDLHAQVLSYDYYTDQDVARPSLARIATLIETLRGATQNLMVFDNGDFLQGSPLSDHFTDLNPPEDIPHPVIQAMNLIGYDGASLGNHEFNLALTKLVPVLRQANFPLFCANLHPLNSARKMLHGVWKPHAILPRSFTDDLGHSRVVRVGVFGTTPPQVLQWDQSRVSGQLRAEDSVAAARRSVRALRKAGADIIIGLAHTGLSAEDDTGNLENAGRHIADIPGVDALVLGHSHLQFPGPGQPEHPAIRPKDGTVCGTPCIMPAASAEYLGRIDLELARRQERWVVNEHKASLLAVTSDLAQDTDMVATIDRAQQRILTEIRKPAGNLSAPIHSFLGILPGCPSVRIVAEAQARHVRDALAGTKLADLPLLSAAAPQKCGGRAGPQHFTNIPAGPVALRHVADLQFFPNDVSALRLTGAEIADWLEMSASLYNQIRPNVVDQPLRKDSVPAYNSDTIFGLTYQIDLTQPARFDAEGELINPKTRRVRNLRWQGRPIGDSQDFVLAVNNYRAGGGGNFPNVSSEKIVLQGDRKIHDLLVASLKQQDSPIFTDAIPWTFTRIPGADVIFETGPALRPTLEHTNPFGLEVLGENAEGFLRLRLTLDQ